MLKVDWSKSIDALKKLHRKVLTEKTDNRKIERRFGEILIHFVTKLSLKVGEAARKAGAESCFFRLLQFSPYAGARHIVQRHCIIAGPEILTPDLAHSVDPSLVVEQKWTELPLVVRSSKDLDLWNYKRVHLQLLVY